MKRKHFIKRYIHIFICLVSKLEINYQGLYHVLYQAFKCTVYKLKDHMEALYLNYNFNFLLLFKIIKCITLHSKLLNAHCVCLRCQPV